MTASKQSLKWYYFRQSVAHLKWNLSFSQDSLIVCLRSISSSVSFSFSCFCFFWIHFLLKCTNNPFHYRGRRRHTFFFSVLRDCANSKKNYDLVILAQITTEEKQIAIFQILLFLADFYLHINELNI